MKHITRIFCILTVLAMLVIPVLADPDENITTPESCDHTFGPWTNAGDSHTQSCTKCGAVNTAAHSWISGAVTVQPTCSTEGEQTSTCSACSASTTQKLSPTGVHTLTGITSAGNDLHTGTCTACSQQISQPHTWNSGTTVKNATCQEPGEKSYTCTSCQQTKTEVTERLTTHNWTNWTRVDDTLHRRKCADCDIRENGEHSYKDVWVQDSENHYRECAACGDPSAPEAHIPGPEATATEPQLCTICAYVIAPATNHTHEFEDQWTANGEGHWYACAGCNERSAYTDHKFDNDCDEYCNICNYPRKITHTFAEGWLAVSKGHYHQCTVCDYVQDEAAHTPGPAATATTAQTCTECGYEIAPALGQQQTTSTQKTNKKESMPWWGAVLIALGAAALIPVIHRIQGD